MNNIDNLDVPLTQTTVIEKFSANNESSLTFSSKGKSDTSTSYDATNSDKLVEIQGAMLVAERERLKVEQQRLEIEQERLNIDCQRFFIEQKKAPTVYGTTECQLVTNRDTGSWLTQRDVR